MRSPTSHRFGRLAICGVLALTTLVAACSDDDSDGDAAPNVDRSTEPAASDSEWCEASRRGQNLPPAESLEATKEVAEIAPDRLKEDFVVLIDLLEFMQENPSDAVGLSERSQAAEEPVERIIEAQREECGLTVTLTP